MTLTRLQPVHRDGKTLRAVGPAKSVLAYRMSPDWIGSYIRQLARTSNLQRLSTPALDHHFGSISGQPSGSRNILPGAKVREMSSHIQARRSSVLDHHWLCSDAANSRLVRNCTPAGASAGDVVPDFFLYLIMHSWFRRSIIATAVTWQIWQWTWHCPGTSGVWVLVWCVMQSATCLKHFLKVRLTQASITPRASLYNQTAIVPLKGLDSLD